MVASCRPRVSRALHVAVASAALAGLAGCGSMYQKSGESFAEGYDAAAKLVSSQLDARRRTRRMLALQLYLDDGPNDLGIGKDVDTSFELFACAGEDELQRERGALKVLKTYKAVIGEVSKDPEDTVSARWKSIRENWERRAPLQPPTENTAALAECRELVRSLVKKPGEGIAELKAEAVLDAYDGVSKVIGSLEKIALPILKIVDEWVRARALRDFVKTNDALVDQMLTNELSDQRLQALHERRLRAALVVPYAQFRGLYPLAERPNRAAVATAAWNVHRSLSDFDLLRVEPAPKDVVKVMREAQAQLRDLANGKVDVKQAWTALQVLGDALKDLKKAVDEAKDDKASE